MVPSGRAKETIASAAKPIHTAVAADSLIPGERSPADDYVAEFTREAPRAKILSAGAIARPQRNGEAISGSVSADKKVAEFAKEVEAAAGAFAVHDADGKLVGVVDRAAVMSVLIGSTQAS